ncbi:ATP-dependent Clp protease proteolytic subunit [Streptomyces sp. NPDC046887]|uniref:ATP-dependent Clp protease proteolytic subunit n=1 Tax=Streptomyces sp. NPDC046887 TaxID=3155472 RepID=UPI0033DB6BE5
MISPAVPPAAYGARYVLPEFTERTGDGLRTLDPYSALLDGRIVTLGTLLDDTAAGDLIAQLLYLEYAGPDQEVSLYVNSPGGPMDAMTAVYDTVRAIGCEVATVCVGQAATTAALLLAAGTPGKRLILPSARVVLREPALPEPLRGHPSDLERHADEVLRRREQLAGMLAHHTGRPRDRVDADLSRTTVLDAEAAVAYGLADQVTTRRAG